MEKYTVYHTLKMIQAIAQQYPGGAAYAKIYTELAEQLSSRTYRVAVIGEFKRGKSSLVNCILGTEVLPTDILPTTAVVNRIKYGTEQKIEIYYKDGTLETTTVAALADYATKRNEDLAAKIREIVVYYPSVFCQNNVELVDTPGLNDDEFMDKTTLDVLDKIDTAIVTTHAGYPVSETEKKLICRLIEQDDIYHLTFAATFIDRVSDEPEEQDRVVDLIRKRLREDTYQMFCKEHGDRPELIKKAEKILCDPVVFAVSSKLAMKGFVSGKTQLLEESRFPHFKYELSALLTANQERDLLLKAVRMTGTIHEQFEEWHQDLLSRLETELESTKNGLKAAQAYCKTGCVGLPEKLIEVDRLLMEDGILQTSAGAKTASFLPVRRAEQMVLYRLLEITTKLTADESDALSETEAALLAAAADLDAAYQNGTLRQKIYSRLAVAEEYLMESERSGGISEQGFTEKRNAWEASLSLPELSGETLVRCMDPLVLANLLRSADIVALAEYVHGKIVDAVLLSENSYPDRIKAYIASWRSLLLKQNLADKADAEALAAQHAANIRKLHQQKETAVFHYEINRQTLKDAEKELYEMLNQ